MTGGELASDVLRLRFVHSGDRVGHVLEVLQDGSFASVVESIEGTADDIWPPSPPFRDVQFESRPQGRQLALLIGMAGKSHWSASVELDPASGRLTFDVACRLQRDPTWLGSCYRRAMQPAIAAETGILLPGDLHLAMEPAGGAHGTLALASPDELVIHAPGRFGDRRPYTIRWQYSFQSGRCNRKW